MSEKSRSDSPNIRRVYSWASQLASESRPIGYIENWYIWPPEVRQIRQRLKTMTGGIIGLIGLQGVGKSSALEALVTFESMGESKEQSNVSRWVDTKVLSGKDDSPSIFFKWRREPELYKSLQDGTHEISLRFRYRYAEQLMRRIDHVCDPQALDIEWAERKLNKIDIMKLQKATWLKLLKNRKTLFIDTPDYSKTDRRMMAKDLNEIYWLWSGLAKDISKPNFVIAIQKEMFHDHFFFDKMTKVELEPLEPKIMLEAYVKRFNTAQPFNKEALLTLAKMSRGIFRRFLRYITLTLDLWTTQPEPRKLIGPETVTKAISHRRLAEDMELELSEIFPKNIDFRLQAVRLLTHLESGSQTQSQLSEELDLPPYTISRLLSKLELHNYINRQRKGMDKLISIK